MNVSYAITVCNERKEIENLIGFLIQNKHPLDEIVVLFDTTNGTKEVETYLDVISAHISLHKHPFISHFANWKNLLNSFCSKDYIFQIDADEGLTNDHIKKWGWNVDDMSRVNWPDYQWRLYKNHPTIKWINKVHEVLDGFKTYSALPSDMESGLLFLNHPKSIERQEKQNEYYNTL